MLKKLIEKYPSAINEAEQDYKKLFGLIGGAILSGEESIRSLETAKKNVIFNFKNTYL